MENREEEIKEGERPREEALSVPGDAAEETPAQQTEPGEEELTGMGIPEAREPEEMRENTTEATDFDQAPGENSDPVCGTFVPRQEEEQPFAASENAAPRISAAPPGAGKPAGRFRRFFVAVGAGVLLVAVSCGITAAIISEQKEEQYQQLRSQIREQAQSISRLEQRMQTQTLSYDQKIAVLENQLRQAGSGISQGTSVETPQGMMTPSQLYAQCVSSVVAITSEGFSGQSTGSGFVLTEDGYIVTNHHVIEGGEELTVTMTDGTQYDARLIGLDRVNDVALLKVRTKQKLPAVTIGSSQALQVGDQVVAIGNPLGNLTTTATVGYISGKDRPVNTDGIIIDMLQTDAAINSGNSGGPLFNMYGQVVGITTAKYSGTTGSGASIEGIGFAIPIDDVTGMISDLKEYGFITGGYLGVEVSNMNQEVAQLYNLPVGAYVQKVTEGSCAQTAGIQPEDIILSLGGYEVENITDLTRVLRNFKAGDMVAIEVYRGGARITLTAILDAKPGQ